MSARGGLPPFVGRERDLSAVATCLRTREMRLVTVVAPSGTGKTRLVQEISTVLEREFADGVAYVDVGVTPAAELVAPTLARTIGVTGDVNPDAFAAALAGRRLLLVLDDVGPGAVDAVADLVAACDDSRVLATAERPLGIAGERVYQLSSLGDAPFDGSPLARELAAALPLKTKADGAETLVGLLELAWDALPPSQQRCLAWLSVSIGGWTRESAVFVCGQDVEEALSELERRRLVTRGDDRRWTMHPAVRTYATAKLELAGETYEAQRRLATWLLQKTERVRLLSLEHAPPDAEAQGAVEEEATGLQAALAWAHAHEPNLFIQLVRGAWWSYRNTSRAEARIWLERALEASRTADERTRGDILFGIAVIAWDAGDYEEADTLAREVLALRRADSDPGLLADALMLAANSAAGDRDYDRAVVLFEEARQLALATANDWALRFATFNLGDTHLVRGDNQAAESCFQEALRLHESANRPVMAALTRAMLGHVALRRGDDARAEDLLRATIEAVRAGNAESVELMMGLEGLAWVAVNRGDLDRGARLLGAADRIRTVEGIPIQDSERVARDHVRAALDDAAEPCDDAQAQGYALEEAEAAAYALAG